MRVHVVAGVLEDERGRILLTRRPEHVHQGGLWEFPGGKLEEGESPVEGLKRELREELTPLTYRPLIRVAHDYGDKHILLDVFRVHALEGEPRGVEQQPLAWVAPDQLTGYAMPAADRPIVAAVNLPDRYVFTPPSAGDGASFMQSMDTALSQGVRLVQMRLFGPRPDELETLARQAVDLCHARGAKLIVNSDLSLARRSGADGLHLSARQLSALACRPDGLAWVCASCHSAPELQRAAELGLDFAVLSPVLPTPSHPDAQPLGWQRFADLVNNASMPVYALGGMDASLLATAWQAGAQGVAGIRGFWPRND